MLIDPRTLKEVQEPAECHLIPAWCGMSNLTVSLEKQIDNDLGSACDAELENYLNALLGKQLPGKVSMTGGSRSLRATYDVVAGELAIHPPRRVDEEQFLERAIGAKGGEAELESFTGLLADGHLAAVSAIHSALLVLHYFCRPEILGPSFDSARALIMAAIDENLTDDHRALINVMVKFELLAPAKAVEEASAELAALRGLHDENLDAGDGVDVNFPNQSVQDIENSIVVILPYSKNIRAKVLFPKQP